jgi:hypothetical protein
MLQRRPGFEALESMTLLSGLAGAAASTPAPLPIHLTGSISGIRTFKAITGTGDLGASASFPVPIMKESGSISPLGDIKEKVADTIGPLSLFTLKGNTGTIGLDITGLDTPRGGTQLVEKFFKHSGSVARGEYTIAFGTGAFAGATGSGNFQITSLGHGKYTETYS